MVSVLNQPREHWVQEGEARLLGGVILMPFAHRWSVKDSACPVKCVSGTERSVIQRSGTRLISAAQEEEQKDREFESWATRGV